MKKQRLYIAYGSNLNLPQMAYRCPTARVVGKSEIKDYELLFRGARRGGVATVEPKEGSAVPVLLWDIKPADEMALDRYEGYPTLYQKQVLNLELDGKSVEAMVYVMTPGHEFGVPSDFYVDTIMEGYGTAGFDPQVLEDAIDHACELVKEQEVQTGQRSLFGMGGWDTLQ